MENQQPSLFEGKKTCKVCKVEKDITEFRLTHHPGYTTQRRHTTCSECLKKWSHDHYQNTMTPERRKELNERERQWRKDHPEQTKAKAKKFHAKYNERDRRRVFAHYGGKCSCCGECEPMFLTIDHINNDGHIERKSGLYTSGSQFYRSIIQRGFPEEYQVLCFNCNLGRARNKGICPHQEGSEIRSRDRRAKRLEAPAVLSSRQDDDMTPTA